MSSLLNRPTRVILAWAVADNGFWVASTDGAFAGTIDRHGQHYFVRNGFDEYVGDYPTLQAGKAALTDHHVRTSSGT